MKVDNPLAFRFIMPDDLYLLEADKGHTPVTPAVAKTAATESALKPEPPIEPEQLIQVADIPLPVNHSKVTTPSPAFNYLGNNNKRFLILTHYATEPLMAAAHFTALENILKRKDLTMDDVVLLNTFHHQNTTMKELHGHFKPEKVLILGAAAIPAGLKAPQLNQPVKTSTIAILYSFGFDEMMESNDNKKAFWDQMKNL